MPKIEPGDLKMRSQILKNLRGKIDMEIGKIDKLGEIAKGDNWLYLQLDEHVKVGGYLK